MTRVAIVGSREITDAQFVFFACDIYCSGIKDITVVSGGARGVDRLAIQWAKKKGYPYIEHLPEWDKYPKVAGMIRNSLVVADSDMMIAFLDNKSRGTRDAIKKMKAAGKPVYEIEYATA